METVLHSDGTSVVPVAMSQQKDIETIRARISRQVGTYFPDLGTATVAVRLAGVSSRRYSTICFIELEESANSEAAKRGIAVKLFPRQSESAELAKTQFSTLHSIWPAFADGGPLSIPRPLDFYPEFPAIVMERVYGASVQKLFGVRSWLPGSSKQILDACKASGQWLRQLHLATRIEPGPLDVYTKLAKARINLAKFQKAGFSRGISEEISAVLDADARTLSKVPLENAMVHGDFSVDNVLKDGNRYVALDITGKDYNSIYHDLSTFMNSLFLTRLSSPISRAFLRRCSEIFLRGYFGNADHDQTALMFLRLTGLISSANEIMQHQNHRPFVKAWIRRTITHLFQKMLSRRRALASRS